MAKNEIDNNGLSLGLTFVILGFILQIIFWGNDIFIWVSVILIGFGIAGIGMEFEKVVKNSGGASFGVGVLFLLFSFLGVTFFDSVWLKIIFVFPMMFGIYGVISGSLLYKKIRENVEVKNVKDKKEIPNFISLENVASIIAIISSISTIIANF